MQLQQFNIPAEGYTRPTLAQEALFVAQTQMDVREERGNRGPEVARYLASVGLDEGYPWCMAFVYWCVNMAAQRLAVATPLVRTAGVLRQWREVRDSRKLPARNIAHVGPGDIFIMDLGRGLGHAGFVERVSAAGVIHTIEGNTNDEGSREGIEVCRRTRALTEIIGFIKLP